MGKAISGAGRGALLPMLAAIVACGSLWVPPSTASALAGTPWQALSSHRCIASSRASLRARPRRSGGASDALWRTPWKSPQFADSNINGHKPLMNAIQAIKRPSQLLEIIRVNASDFDEVHSATCLYEAARKRKKFEDDFRLLASSKDFKDLIQYLEFQCAVMVPYTVSNTAWSLAEFAMSGFVLDDLASQLAVRTANTVELFSSRHLAGTAWAFGRTRLKHSEMLAAIAAEAIQKMDDFDAQSISNLAWAFANLEEANVPLMRAISARAKEVLQKSTNQALSNLAWAFARLGARDKSLMSGISQEISNTSRRFQGQKFNVLSYLTVAHYCSTMGVFNKKLFDICLKNRAKYVKGSPKCVKWNVCAILYATSKAPRDGEWSETTLALETFAQKEARRRNISSAEMRDDLLDPKTWRIFSDSKPYLEVRAID